MQGKSADYVHKLALRVNNHLIFFIYYIFLLILVKIRLFLLSI